MINSQSLADFLAGTHNHEWRSKSSAIFANADTSAIERNLIARGAFVKLHGGPDLGDAGVVDLNPIPVFDSDFAASTVTWAIAAARRLKRCGSGATLHVDSRRPKRSEIPCA